MKKILLVCVALVAVATANAQCWGIKAGAEFSNYNISAKGLSATVSPGIKTGFYVAGVNNIDFNGTWGLQTELQYSYSGGRLHVGKNFISDIAGGELGGMIGNMDLPIISEILPYFNGKHASAAVNTHKLRLPIMLKFQASNGLSIMAGPYISYRVGLGTRFSKSVNDVASDMEITETIDMLQDVAKDFLNKNTKKFDFGVAMGVEYEFANGIFIDARYNLSLLNSLKNKIDYSDVMKVMMGNDVPPGADFNIDMKKELGIQPTLKNSFIQVGVGFRF